MAFPTIGTSTLQSLQGPRSRGGRDGPSDGLQANRQRQGRAMLALSCANAASVTPGRQSPSQGPLRFAESTKRTHVQDAPTLSGRPLRCSRRRNAVPGRERLSTFCSVGRVWPLTLSAELSTRKWLVERGLLRSATHAQQPADVFTQLIPARPAAQSALSLEQLLTVY
jgi:hypothetical protein